MVLKICRTEDVLYGFRAFLIKTDRGEFTWYARSMLDIITVFQTCGLAVSVQSIEEVSEASVSGEF